MSDIRNLNIYLPDNYKNSSHGKFFKKDRRFWCTYKKWNERHQRRKHILYIRNMGRKESWRTFWLVKDTIFLLYCIFLSYIMCCSASYYVALLLNNRLCSDFFSSTIFLTEAISSNTFHFSYCICYVPMTKITDHSFLNTRKFVFCANLF